MTDGRDPPYPLPRQSLPAHREADIALRDGSTVHVRPIRPDDEQRLLDLLTSLSPDARTLRFFSAGVDLAALARDDSQVDYLQSFGLVATTGPDEHIVGHASYARIDPECAEIAFTIADEYQGRGLGTLLLGQLAETAAANGIVEFRAVVLPVELPHARASFATRASRWSRIPAPTRSTSRCRHR